MTHCMLHMPMHIACTGQQPDVMDAADVLWNSKDDHKNLMLVTFFAKA